MSQRNPRSRREALRRLHPTLRNSTATAVRSFNDVREVEVASSLAEKLHGGWAVLLVCMEGYLMPVQCVNRIGISDIFWYLELGYDLRGGGRFSTSSPPDLGPGSTRMFLFNRGRHAPRPVLVNVSATDESWLNDASGCWWRGRSEREAFPTKKDAPSQKINLWFRDVWHDSRTHFPVASAMFEWASRGKRMFNDEATAWLIWLVSAHATLGSAAGKVVEVLAGNRDAMKSLTTIVKGLGVQSTIEGALLTELDTMFGRGVFVPQEWDDVRARVIRTAFFREKAAVVDQTRLRAALEEICADELSVVPEWGDPDDYWSRRWLFTKAGAHSQHAEVHWRGTKLDLPDRPSRREFSEAQQSNIVALGSPRVDAGISWKLEHGKTRAIYSCDSRSYFTFDYLLKPVEAVWRNRRVLLDPGREPQVMFYRRLSAEGPCRFMLDFDDFNSQHTLESMATAIDVACRGAPPDVLAWCRASWFNMHVHWLGQAGLRDEVMCGTLPSGHRATTFVNTLLNAAYCKIVAGTDYDLVTSRHTGDDVVFSGPQAVCSRIAKAFKSSQFRANPMKQSIGHRSGEFLRVCYDADGARGYPARAISTLVSGNWVTETRVSPRAYAENMVRAAWTISARSGMHDIGKLMISALSRWVPELAGHAYQLLTHVVSLEGSPVRTPGVVDAVDVLRVDGGISKTKRPRMVMSYATDEYIKNHLDFKILEEAEVSVGEVRRAMLSSSYKPREVISVTPLRLATTLTVSLVLHDQPLTFNRLAREGKGEVEALRLLRAIYDTIDWRMIVAIVRGGDRSAMSVEGKMEWPVADDYSTPFSDCMRARSFLTRPGRFINVYPVRV